MANDVIIATAPATEVKSAPVEVAEVSAVEEAAESPVPVDVAEVESEVAEAPAEVAAPVSYAKFAVDGDILKPILERLLPITKYTIDIIATTDALIFRTNNSKSPNSNGSYFTAIATVNAKQGYTPNSIGSCTVKKLVIATLGKAIDESTRYIFQQDARRLHIRDAASDVAFSTGIVNADFDFGYDDTAANKITVYQSDIRAVLKKVIHAAGQSEFTTPYIYFTGHDKTLTVAATDSAQFTKATCAFSGGDGFDFALPVDTVNFLRAFKESKKGATVEFAIQQKGKVVIAVDGWQIRANTVYADNMRKFLPMADRMLTAQTQDTAALSALRLQSALKVCLPCLGIMNPFVTVKIRRERAEIIAAAEDGSKVTMQIAARLAGDYSEIEFGIDAKKFLANLATTTKDVTPLLNRADKCAFKAASLGSALKDARTLADTLRAEKSQAESQAESLQAQTDKKAAKTVAAELSKSNKKILKLTKQLKDAETEIARLESTIAQLQSEAEALRQQAEIESYCVIGIFDNTIAENASYITLQGSALICLEKRQGGSVFKTRDESTQAESVAEAVA